MKRIFTYKDTDEPVVDGSVMIKLDPKKLKGIPKYSDIMWLDVLMDKISKATEGKVTPNAHHNLFGREPDKVGLFFESAHPRAGAEAVIAVLKANDYPAEWRNDYDYSGNNFYDLAEVAISYDDTQEPDEYETVFKSGKFFEPKRTPTPAQIQAAVKAESIKATATSAIPTASTQPANTTPIAKAVDTSPATQEDFYGTWVQSSGYTYIISADAFKFGPKSNISYKVSPLTWTALKDGTDRYSVGFSLDGKDNDGEESQHRLYISKDKSMIRFDYEILPGKYPTAKRLETVQQQQAEKAENQTEKKPLAISFKYVDCPTCNLELGGFIMREGYALARQDGKMCVWDTTAPTNLQKIKEIEWPEKGGYIFGDTMYAITGDFMSDDDVGEHFDVYDISDLLNIVKIKEFTVPRKFFYKYEHIEDIVLHQGKLLARLNHGRIVEVRDDGTFHKIYNAVREQSAALYSRGNLLISIGDLDGIQIFDTSKGLDYLTELKHIASFDSGRDIPLGLTWLDDGMNALLVGEDIIKVDFSNPAKTKLTKAAKTGLYGGGYKIEGDLLYSYGFSKANIPTICVVDVSGELPEIVYKQAIREYKQNLGIGHSNARDIVKIGDYFILRADSHTLGVVKIIHAAPAVKPKKDKPAPQIVSPEEKKRLEAERNARRQAREEAKKKAVREKEAADLAQVLINAGVGSAGTVIKHACDFAFYISKGRYENGTKYESDRCLYLFYPNGRMIRYSYEQGYEGARAEVDTTIWNILNCSGKIQDDEYLIFTKSTGAMKHAYISGMKASTSFSPGISRLTSRSRAIK